jgi:hypothetical protein
MALCYNMTGLVLILIVIMACIGNGRNTKNMNGPQDIKTMTEKIVHDS